MKLTFIQVETVLVRKHIARYFNLRIRKILKKI